MPRGGRDFRVAPNGVSRREKGHVSCPSIPWMAPGLDWLVLGAFATSAPEEKETAAPSYEVRYDQCT